MSAKSFSTSRCCAAGAVRRGQSGHPPCQPSAPPAPTANSRARGPAFAESLAERHALLASPPMPTDLSTLTLSMPAPIEDLALLALQDPRSGWAEADGSQLELAREVAQLLDEKVRRPSTRPVPFPACPSHNSLLKLPPYQLAQPGPRSRRQGGDARRICLAAHRGWWPGRAAAGSQYLPLTPNP